MFFLVSKIFWLLAQPLSMVFLLILGAAGALLGRRSRAVSVLAGTALTTGSLLTRFGVFQAGLASAKDPKYTVVPQRERLDRRA